MRIQVLPRHLVDQIAAGEVIERPASIVKELVENSLDAGAKRIQVALAEGGKQLVRVEDNGHGILRDDLPLAFASHATSKIQSLEDLTRVGTLGFRGEALASVGAVSRARIVSRVRGASLGGRVEMEGGELRPAQEAGAPLGTTVEVRDLFYNLPARRKFLKSTSTELGQAAELLLRIALPFEGVEFTLEHEGKRLWQLPAGMGIRERIGAAFGADWAEALIPLEARSRWAAISGFLGHPRLSRADTNRQFFYCNGRFIRDKALLRALREAYRELLPHGRQPVAFLFLGVEPSKVDQNVHPTKAEIRFREGRELFEFFLHSAHERLQEADLSAPGTMLLPRPPLHPAVPETGIAAYAPVSSRQTSVVREAAPPLFPGAPAAPVPYLQVHDTYLVLETPEGFDVIDQHALHERVLFEEFKEDYSRGGIAVQRLLVPELVEVSRVDLLLLEEKKGELRRAGFEVEPFGETTVAVRGVPARLRRLEIRILVEELLAAARGEKDPERHPFYEEVLHRAACRAAVMAGDPLSREEVQALLTKASLLQHDQSCPHARPTRVCFTLADLERAFQRR